MNSVLLSGSTFPVLDSRTNQRGNGIAPSAEETMRKQWTNVLTNQKRIGDRGSENDLCFKELLLLY